jgi:hypothetical protein
MKEGIVIFEEVGNTRSAQILHFSEGELKLALELNHTQYALTISIRTLSQRYYHS